MTEPLSQAGYETVATEFDLEMTDVYRALACYYDHTDEMAM